MRAEPIRVGQFSVPASELVWSFDPSGGPGGQHANRSSTRVTLTFDLATTEAFPEEVKERMLARLGKGEVSVIVDESRSQWRNRKISRRRMAERLEAAARPEKQRRPTRPTRAGSETRLRRKRRRSETKRLRRRPEKE